MADGFQGRFPRAVDYWSSQTRLAVPEKVILWKIPISKEEVSVRKEKWFQAENLFEEEDHH